MPASTRRADFRRYAELVAERPDLFTSEPNGIHILLDEAEIAAAQRHIARRNRARGLPPASASVGVLAEDAYILALRDAIRFPDGSLGTHNRIVYAQRQGVGVLPVFQGTIVLIRIYRHSMRRWMLEIPRGSVEFGRSLEQTVRSEIAEEIGGIVTAMTHIGHSVNDSSLCDGRLDLFHAEVSEIGTPQLAEGIADIIRVTPAEFDKLLLRGEMEDGHGIAAYTQARLRGLLP
ncbi:MAG: NUDIX hydrolase [Phaeospirillum sp.]|nr:NUDIX hydrolase [Phaeospirillum sp.]